MGGRENTQGCAIPSSILIRQLELGDIPSIQRILESWMRDKPDAPVRTDNVEEALARMTERASAYRVVVNADNNVIGVGGFTETGIDEELTKQFPDAVEIVNVYVARNEIGKRHGTALVDTLEQDVTELGYKHLIVVSGSRNRQYGYPFWDRRFGARHRTDPDYFGPNTERVVWVKKLRAH